MTPFVVFSLPRSRSAWLSQFLTYGDWTCGHEELRRMRSLDDVKAWFSQPNIGTVETSAAPWWRLLDTYAPGARVVVVRRPPSEVVESLLNIWGVQFDRAVIEKVIAKHDRKLDQIERRLPNVLSVAFSSLAVEGVCATVFEYCLGYPHDHDHWERLSPVNIQINFPALVKYCQAHAPAMEKLALVAKHRTIAQMAPREIIAPEGITLQGESFRKWYDEGTRLFDEHLTLVGEAPGDWRCKNVPLMQGLDDAGAMQIVTARSNGRMFGYLMTLISPSMASPDRLAGYHTTFYAASEFPGLGLKLQRKALSMLKARGVDEVFMQAGTRGSGERIGSLYRRLGAENNGQLYKLDLTEH
jgi:hypothetical protein